ncbi:hypothetical protein DB347_09400 [Opitutaceae bacterium EW11]|nr:hypothetical protein DB347_09400 [Opitutaceae bacterium EW11]
MKKLLKLLSFAALAGMFAASWMVFSGALSRPTYEIVALSGTVIWFGTVPFWMKRRLHASE